MTRNAPRLHTAYQHFVYEVQREKALDFALGISVMAAIAIFALFAMAAATGIWDVLP